MIKYSQDFKPKPDMPISRNRVMSYLNDLWYSCSAPEGNKPFLKGETAVEWAMEAIEEMPRYTGEWIPVSERLPDAEYGEGDSVLCCTESGLMYILYWNGGNWCVPTGEPHHWVNHKTGWHDKVIAWMPLPESYKTDMRGEE